MFTLQFFLFFIIYISLFPSVNFFNLIQFVNGTWKLPRNVKYGIDEISAVNAAKDSCMYKKKCTVELFSITSV